MLDSLLYVALRRLLQFVAPSCRSREFRELEIVVLRHELAILRRQVGRPALRPADRAFLAAASRFVQQARNFSWSIADRPAPPRFLIHDRDSKFTGAFDEVFRSEGLEIVTTPIQAPRANAYAERFVGTVRRECLDWILVVGRSQLERILKIYVEHYNGHRPHRGLGLVPSQSRPALRLVASAESERIRRRARLGGLIHEYCVAA